MAVAVKEKASPAVTADELVDVPVRVAGAVSLSGVAQDHARAVFLDAGSGIRLIRVWSTRPQIRAGTAPAQVAMPRPCCKFSERSPTHSVWLRPSVMAVNGM